jgi:UDP-GlcNAc:undecaprenyl-phosphate GlcNAc-1-phosphate transferase
LPASFLFGLLALIVCTCAMPLARRIGRRWNLYDRPGPLKIHRVPVPRVGGIAMMAGLGASLLLCPLAAGQIFAVAGFITVWVVSLVDDARGLSPYLRLGFHVVAGVLFWLGGWRLNWTGSTAVDLAFTCFLVAFLINAMNLFDGMDGLAAGTAAIMAIGFLALFSGTQAFFSIVLAWALLGICAGVLVHNIPPARVFMGDAGSTLIGVLLAFLILDWVRVQPDHNIVPPLLLVSVPVADAFLAAARRLRGRRSPFVGDRRHFYDLLVKQGWTLWGVLRLSWGVTAILGVVAWLSRGDARSLRTIAAACVVTAAFAAAAMLLGSLRGETEKNPVAKAPLPAHAELSQTNFTLPN